MGENFLFDKRIQLIWSVLQSKQEVTEDEEMKQQRMAIMKDLIKKIRSNGSVDVQNRWWVSELLGTDCEKAWTPHRMGER